MEHALVPLERLPDGLCAARPDGRAEGARALARLGEQAREHVGPALEQLVETLAAGVPALSDQAGEVLRSLGKVAVPALLRGLRHPDQVRRMRCASVLRTMGPALEAAVSDFVSLLAHPAPEVREEAAWALGLLGRSAARAVVRLSAALEDPSPDVRAAAEASLKVLRTYFVRRPDAQPAAEGPGR